MASRQELGIYAKASMLDLKGDFLKIAQMFFEKFRFNPSVGLCISGPPGVGKSHTAAAVINRIQERSAPRIDTCFISSPHLYECYFEVGRDRFYDLYRDHPMWRTLERVPVLVWNDLGKENRTGLYVHQVIYSFGKLLRCRVESGLSTLFTTNLSLEEKKFNSIFNTYGENFASLFHEASEIKAEVKGKDRRRKVAV